MLSTKFLPKFQIVTVNFKQGNMMAAVRMINCVERYVNVPG